jgi:hypothetical protein
MLRVWVIACVFVATAAADPASTNPKTCPKTFKLALAGGACAVGNQLAPACDYVEGHCQCMTPRMCSGVPHPAPPVSTARWSCVPVVRADGCPGVRPSGKCSPKHLPKAGCTYADGCAGITLGCVSGQWKMTSMSPPPP